MLENIVQGQGREGRDVISNLDDRWVTVGCSRHRVDGSLYK